MSKNKVTYVQQEVPAFLKRFKEKVGYKEEPSVETKRQKLEELEAEDREDRDDERPQIVVLKKGDLSEERVDQLKQQGPSEGKLVFKKPIKSPKDKKTFDLQVTTSTKTKKNKTPPKKNEGRKIRDKKLLSFGDDEEEEED